MVLIFKHAWALFILVMISNALICYSRSQKYIRQHPEKKPGYLMMFRSLALYANIPWIIAGVGVLTGNMDSIFDIFYPRSLKPFVLLFYLISSLLYLRLAIWVFMQKGDQFIEDHPGFFQRSSLSTGPKSITAKDVRFLTVLFVALFLFALFTFSMSENMIPEGAFE